MNASKVPSRTVDKYDLSTRIIPGQKAFSLFTRRSNHRPIHGFRLSQHRFVLNNGSGEIPALGFGTSLSDNKKTEAAVKTAVEVGFRHLDAAERYRNEAQVGAALTELFADGTVRRE